MKWFQIPIFIFMVFFLFFIDSLRCNINLSDLLGDTKKCQELK